eukprot:scaffold84811_cov75-Phaeocystis_antarctica.AAC.2
MCTEVGTSRAAAHKQAIAMAMAICDLRRHRAPPTDNRRSLTLRRRGRSLRRCGSSATARPAVARRAAPTQAAYRRRARGSDRTGEGGADHSLDLGVGRVVDRRGGLVEDEDARVPQQRARHANELPLALREVLAVLGHRGEQRVDALALTAALDELLDGCAHLALLERRPDLRVGVLVKGVHIGAHAARKERGALRDDRDLAPQLGQAEAARVHPVNRDRRLPEECISAPAPAAGLTPVSALLGVAPVAALASGLGCGLGGQRLHEAQQREQQARLA